ncbi:MAG: hypothetical protein ACI8Z0_002440, partial [Lentimonas sp.]
RANYEPLVTKLESHMPVLFFGTNWRNQSDKTTCLLLSEPMQTRITRAALIKDRNSHANE